jgi:S-DNA-T family DNA segregation ATPase FtsK/SpoIIIE
VIDCDECGLVYATISPVEIPGALRAFGPGYGSRLGEEPARLRSRPSPAVWSVLEYACHVRDVLEVQRERLALALVEDRPTFVPMGRDARVVDGRYNEQDPSAVAHQLAVNAEAIAAAFAALGPAEWERTGIYNWPTSAERSMLWLGQHTIHEGRHHLRDIDAQLA